MSLVLFYTVILVFLLIVVWEYWFIPSAMRTEWKRGFVTLQSLVTKYLVWSGFPGHFHPYCNCAFLIQKCFLDNYSYRVYILTSLFFGSKDTVVTLLEMELKHDYFCCGNYSMYTSYPLPVVLLFAGSVIHSQPWSENIKRDIPEIIHKFKLSILSCLRCESSCSPAYPCWVWYFTC